MADAEIIALRAKLAGRPRPDDYRQRRRDIDARGREYGIAADVAVETITAGGGAPNGPRPQATPARLRSSTCTAAAM